MNRPKLLAAVVGLFLLIVVAFANNNAAAENRTNIDPSKEKIIVTIGGIDMDIPLGYFYEKTIWSKGQWPRPNKERTVVKDRVVIDAHLDGMKPWSRDLAADFKGAGVKTTRITISALYSQQWLENQLRASPRIREVQASRAAPGLKAFRTDERPQVDYLRERVPQKPYFNMECDERSIATRCDVTSDYAGHLVIRYSIPVLDITRWESIHTEVVALLNSFQTKKGD